jgi:hypothetical protein
LPILLQFVAVTHQVTCCKFKNFLH